MKCLISTIYCYRYNHSVLIIEIKYYNLFGRILLLVNLQHVIV